jgi:hypothetical protein
LNSGWVPGVPKDQPRGATVPLREPPRSRQAPFTISCTPSASDTGPASPGVNGVREAHQLTDQIGRRLSLGQTTDAELWSMFISTGLRRDPDALLSSTLLHANVAMSVNGIQRTPSWAINSPFSRLALPTASSYPKSHLSVFLSVRSWLVKFVSLEYKKDVHGNCSRASQIKSCPCSGFIRGVRRQAQKTACQRHRNVHATSMTGESMTLECMSARWASPSSFFIW